MELGKFPKDVIQYLALEMDIGELLSLCRTNKELNVKICKNRNIWINKLNKDFPDWINKDESEKKNLSKLYQTLVLDRDFPGWKKLPENKEDLLALYKKLLKINKIHKSDYGIETDYYMFKLGEEYPDTDFNKMYDAYFYVWPDSPKEFYKDAKNRIDELDENYNYKYKDGDPFKQFGAFNMFVKRTYYDYDGLLEYILNYSDALSLGLVEYCIDHGAKITETMIKILDSPKLKIPFSKNDDNLIKLKKLINDTLNERFEKAKELIIESFGKNKLANE